MCSRQLWFHLAIIFITMLKLTSYCDQFFSSLLFSWSIILNWKMIAQVYYEEAEVGGKLSKKKNNSNRGYGKQRRIERMKERY